MYISHFEIVFDSFFIQIKKKIIFYFSSSLQHNSSFLYIINCLLLSPLYELSTVISASPISFYFMCMVNATNISLSLFKWISLILRVLREYPDDFFERLHCYRCLISMKKFELIGQLEVAQNRVQRFRSMDRETHR